jgi:hypothetical protein
MIMITYIYILKYMIMIILIVCTLDLISDRRDSSTGFEKWTGFAKNSKSGPISQLQNQFSFEV